MKVLWRCVLVLLLGGAVSQAQTVITESAMAKDQTALLSAVLSLLLASALLYLMTFRWWSSGALGGLGLLLSVALLVVAGFVYNTADADASTGWLTFQIAIGVVGWLLGSVVVFVSRLAVWWRREPWWVTLGNSLMASLLLGLSFWALDSLLSEVSSSLNLFGRPIWVIVPLLLSPLIALWVIWRRGKLSTISP